MLRFIALLIFACITLGTPARATITSSASTVTLVGNGSQTSFAFSFVGVAASDIVVIYTTSAGVQTTLVQGSGPTQVQITLNAAVPPSLWGAGGNVIYNPSGTPIPSGSTLTITRTLPFTQATSLQNQASFGQYATATEQALDQIDMQVQQLNTAIGYAIQANPANSTPPAVLPPAAQIAGLGICADGTGLNLIGCSLAPAGTISSAMAPVVGAASLSAGRSAFGLGSMAVENINAGTCGGPSIQDDGSGNARVVETTVPDSTNLTVTCNFHLQYHIASGPLTYTLSRASTTYFNGFAFVVTSAAGVTTVTPNAADNFSGVASGTSISIPQGSTCTITTNGASTGVWYARCGISTPNLDAALANGNTALTLTLYAPSLQFRDNTLANGDILATMPAAGISITIPSGATLGTSGSNTPFRVWIFATYNGGTPQLAVATCSAAGAIYPCAAWETLRRTATGITSGSTALGTLYPATSITNDSVRLIGYADYATGLGSAGTWASKPTTLQVCIPPFSCKRPGDMVQMGPICSQTASGTTTSAAFVTLSTNPQTCQITPTASPNLVRIQASGSMTLSGGAAFLQVVRGATLIGNPVGASTAAGFPTSLLVWDAPGVSTAVTYGFVGKISGGATLTYPSANSGSTIELWEIMGANDNGSDALRRTG